MLKLAKKDDAADAVAVARDIRSTSGFVLQAARLLGRTRVLWIVGLTVALVAIVAAAEMVGVPVAGTAAAVAGWIGVVARLVRTPLENTRKASAAADELLTGLRDEQQAELRRREADVHRELAQLAARRVQLDAELEAARSAADRATREIADIESGRRITQFVEERATSAEYRQYLGLIALIRRDFDELTRLLLDQESVDKPPFDRVILYIDDLDRCRAELVVQVLEAVHLLLALKLFVVVVGVDPRWLAQSLKRHYIGQLGLDDGDGFDPDATEWATTPQNYLEKIFQIPFALEPMGTDGFSRMMGGLFELRSPGSDNGARPGTASETAPDNATPSNGATPAEGAAVEVDGDADPERVIPEPEPEVAPDPPPPPRERTRELLRIWSGELEFIQRLGALVPTPRAANRLANTYRLIRVRQDGPGLARFVTGSGEAGEYQVALVLLTVVVGFGEIADDVLRRLLDGKHRSFWPFVASLTPPAGATQQEAAAYTRLRAGLETLKQETDLPTEITVYRDWVPRVARYSFQTARLS